MGSASFLPGRTRALGLALGGCHVSWVPWPGAACATAASPASGSCVVREPRAGDCSGMAGAGEQRAAASWAVGTSQGLSHRPQAGLQHLSLEKSGSSGCHGPRIWRWVRVFLRSQGRILRPSRGSAEPQLPSGLCLSCPSSATCLLPRLLLKIAQCHMLWCHMLCPPTAAPLRGHLRPRAGPPQVPGG